MKKTFILLAISLSLGCSAVKMPQVPEQIKKKYADDIPQSTLTNFKESLACMDDLLLANEVDTAYLASEGLFNYTSENNVSRGGVEMLITALSQMSIRSNAVRFVSFHNDLKNMLALQSAHPNKDQFRIPDYFIRGGVTQYNKGLWRGQKGTGISLSISQPDYAEQSTGFFTIRGEEDVSGSFSKSSNYATMTLDMSAGQISNLQIIPGMASSSTLALELRHGKAYNGDLTLGNLGVSYNVSNYILKDFNSLYRTLIESGAIEIVGKMHKVPYWKCLYQAGENKLSDKKLLEEYTELTDEKQVQLLDYVQSVLASLKYTNFTPNGAFDEATQFALQRYQQHMGMVASGRVNYETYRMMRRFSSHNVKVKFN